MDSQQPTEPSHGSEQVSTSYMPEDQSIPNDTPNENESREAMIEAIFEMLNHRPFWHRLQATELSNVDNTINKWNDMARQLDNTCNMMQILRVKILAKIVEVQSIRNDLAKDLENQVKELENLAKELENLAEGE
jgi:uncharacterized coiled-coil DUF342 family protein